MLIILVVCFISIPIWRVGGICVGDGGLDHIIGAQRWGGGGPVLEFGAPYRKTYLIRAISPL